jgi:hypothetical protein
VILNKFTNGAGIATAYGLDGSVQFSAVTVSRPALLSSYPMRTGDSFSGELNRPGREADHLPPSSAGVKNSGAVPPLPHKSSWRGALIKQRKTSLST